MEATKYTEILEQALFLFINDIYAEGHKFMADNDPKHMCTSLYAWNYGTSLKKGRHPLETWLMHCTCTMSGNGDSLPLILIGHSTAGYMHC